MEIKTIDANFAPDVERMDLTYTIKPAGATAAAAKLEVFKKGDNVTPIFKDETIPKTGANVVYKQGGVNGWDGKAGGAFITPHDSEYKVRITVSNAANFANPKSDSETTKVEIESLEINLKNPTKLMMNDPDHNEKVSVLVKLKKKDGTGIQTVVPMYVHFSFVDTDSNNYNWDDSFEYAAGKYLGKIGNPAAIHWADHPDAEADSTDGFKLVCRCKTITVPPGDIGMARVWFKAAGVGHDDYILKAVVKHNDGSELASIESAELTVWRSVTFDRIYEMDGQTHVSTNGTKAKIQPYFDPAFVEYNVGAVTQIDAAKSVKYIGLWKNQAPHQLDWAVIQAKLPAETPTPAELADAEGPAGPVRDAARAAITTKAQAWVNRIDGAFLTSRNQWKTNGGIANNSLVAVKYFHPKYNRLLVGGGNNPDTITDEWPGWVRVTTFGGSYANVDPDSYWSSGGTFSGLSVGDGIVAIGCTETPNETTKTIVHEAGHATRFSFKRALFGPSRDHSPQPGLMDLPGSENEFSVDELKILLGIKL